MKIYFFQVNVALGKVIGHCLLVMIEIFKEAVDRDDQFGVVLTDLSKVFDRINHPLLIAKIDSYRTQRSSKRFNILHGVALGSILGRLLLNIDLSDLFYQFEESDIASYADDATPYSCGSETQSVIAELQIDYWEETFSLV